MQVSVLLPTYEERDNIVPLLERIDAVLAGRGYEAVVVDDGSPDGTAAEACRYAASNDAVRVVVRTSARGLAGALARGVAEARHPIVAWLDCDGSMPPETLPRLLEPIERGEADLVIGSRFLPGGGIKGQDPQRATLGWLGIARNLKGTEDSLLAVALSTFGNSLLRWMLTSQVTDWTSGFVATRASVLAAVPLEGDYGEYFLSFVYRVIRAGWRVREVPYVIVPRMSGVSKTGETLLEYLARGRVYVTTAWRVRAQLAASSTPKRVAAT